MAQWFVWVAMATTIHLIGCPDQVNKLPAIILFSAMISDERKIIRLYHYLGARWALDDIRRHRLKLSKLDDLNDPYEWACVYSTDPDSQRALERTRMELVDLQGMQSFSRDWNNILMWSHYGEKHQGICLGFDVLKERTRAVTYVGQVKIIGDLAALPQKAQLAIIDRLTWAKYKGWSYEKEVRAKAHREEKDPETCLYFVDFDETLTLREVIAGAKSTVTKQEIDSALEGYSGVTITKLRPNPKKFEMIVDGRGFNP